MKCRITCHGKTKEVEIALEESLLEAAIVAEMEPPYSCLEGICGTCVARLESGEVVSPIEISGENLVKTCMARPKSDISINYDKV